MSVNWPWIPDKVGVVPLAAWVDTSLTVLWCIMLMLAVAAFLLWQVFKTQVYSIYAFTSVTFFTKVTT